MHNFLTCFPIIRFAILSGVVLLVGLPLRAEPDSLKGELAQHRASASERLDAHTRQTFARGLESIRETGVEQQALNAGDQAPAFTLPRASGDLVSLRDELQEGPVVLTFYRGGWCPYCNIQLQAYQRRLEAIRAAGGQLIAVSPDQPDDSLTTAQKHDLAFTVLSDDDNEVARRYGLVFELPEGLKDKYLEFGIPLQKKDGSEDSYELPVPATYVIDRGGTIRWSFINADYTRRALPDDIIRALEKL